MNADDNWEPDEPLDIGHYWNVFRRAKWTILASALVAAIAAFALASRLTPIYSASAIVLIESDQPNIVSIEEVYSLDSPNQQYFDTQFEILRSRSLAETVLSNLSLLDTEEFRPNRQANDSGWRAWISGLRPDQEDAEGNNEIYTAIEIYSDRLAIEPIADTQLVRIRFESADPHLAAGVANAHAEAYIESMLDARLSVTESAAAWMNKRLDEMRTNMLAAESELQAFREREQLVDAEGLRALPSQKVNELSSRLVEVRQLLASAEIAYRQSTQVDSDDIDTSLQSLPGVLDDPAVRRFQEAHATAQQRVAELSGRYGPKHPRMIEARAELETARDNLARQRVSVADRIRREYDAARDEEQSLLAELDRARTEYQSIGRMESELNSLQQAVDTQRQIYELFYRRLSETTATGDLKNAQARIVEPAVAPIHAVKPRTRFIVVGSFVAIFLTGVFVAFLRDRLNTTLRNVSDVEQKLDRPLLAMLPLLKGPYRRKLPLGIVENAEFRETIRTLRTALMLDKANRSHRAILLTSAVSGEGKSTVALNLAASLAKSGRALLIDADLRRPSLGRMIGSPDAKAGLSELLACEATFRDCCLGSSGIPNLHIIRAGSPPGDPLELLSHARFPKLLNVLRQTYAWIVIDSPPILPVSDAAVLSGYVDSVVFVAKADKTPVKQARAGLDLLARVSAPVSGIVLNGLDMKKARKYSDFGYGGYYEAPIGRSG